MKRFRKVVEDFDCLQCGAYITGTGYTNHCPDCLYSRHVDVLPGDRSADCGGMMEPYDILLDTKGIRIIHRCLQCGYKHVNKLTEQDSKEVAIQLMKTKSDQKARENKSL